MDYIEYTVKVYANGDKFWYLNDKLHREDGPAFECANGYKSWYLNGNLHREDGPAVEYTDGSKSWYLNGELHREDGPAIEYEDGYNAWYLNGEFMTESEHAAATKPVKELTVAEIEALLGYSVKVVK